MIAKAPKTGTAFIFSFIFAIYYFFTNSMIIISAMIAAAGIIMELIMMKGGYKNKSYDCLRDIWINDNDGSQCSHIFAKRCYDCGIIGEWNDAGVY